MGSSRGGVLYSGKSRMAHQRNQAQVQFDHEAIEEYYDRAAWQPREKTPVKIALHTNARNRARSQRPLNSNAGSGSVEPRSARPGIPIPTMRPRRLTDVRHPRNRFSFVQLGYGLALGTAAGLLGVWLLDAAIP